MRRFPVLFNALVMLILIVLAAALQDGVRPVAWGHVKLPFLLAVVVYYAMVRPLACAAPAALWAGLLQDGLGGLPPGTSLVGMAGVVAFCALWGRTQLPESRFSCVLVGACAAAATALLQYAALRLSGGLPSLPTDVVVARAALYGAVAVPVCAVTAAFAGALDRLALNTRMEHDANGFDWSGSSV